MGLMTVAKSAFRIGSLPVDGAAATTNIAVTGILAIDTLISVIEVTVTTAALVDRTAEASITSDGNIQLSTTDTTGDCLLVLWASNDG